MRLLTDKQLPAPEDTAHRAECIWLEVETQRIAEIYARHAKELTENMEAIRTANVACFGEKLIPRPDTMPERRIADDRTKNAERRARLARALAQTFALAVGTVELPDCEVSALAYIDSGESLESWLNPVDNR